MAPKQVFEVSGKKTSNGRSFKSLHNLRLYIRFRTRKSLYSQVCQSCLMRCWGFQFCFCSYFFSIVISLSYPLSFLILRSEELWKETIGEDLWGQLDANGRIITKGHKGMSQHITRGNIKKDNGYDKLVTILKNHE